MKKIILTTVLSCLTFYVFAQQYQDSYILPDHFEECADLSTPFRKYRLNYSNEYTDIAFMHHSDTTATIIGIAAYGGFRLHHDNETYIGYFAIADTNLNNAEQVEMIENDPNSGYSPDDYIYGYVELFFDNPVNVRDDYYIVWYSPKPEYKQNYSYFSFRPSTAICYTDTCEGIQQKIQQRRSIINTVEGGYKRTTTTGDWIPFTNHYAAYLFPIFGEYDPTAKYVGLNDTDIDNYAHVFPNPASDNVTVQCSYKIKQIEVLNALGQTVETKEVNAYNVILNINNYVKGNYFVKIRTNAGTATKQIIVP